MTATLDAATTPDAPATPALEIRDLRCGYDRTTVLRGVSLDIAPQSVVALVGPNGAGKTTLVKALSGLLPVASGTIRLFGEDVTGLSPEARAQRSLCVVPEGRGIYRSLTVRENLTLQAGDGRAADAIERATEAFPRLGERLAQQAGTLSGGEQQMLSLASAYVREPRLVAIDEASLGLAPVVVDEVFAFIDQVRHEGTAMLIIDQFVHRVLDIASTVHVLSRGSVEFSGTPAQFLEGDLFDRYLGGAG
mgnify:CR=1 FL=1